MNDKFFTAIILYKGGSYIHQLTAADVNHAVKKLVISLLDDEYIALSKKLVRRAIEEIDSGEFMPVLIDGCKNVWFSHIKAKKGYLHVNLVLTAA